MKDIIPGAQLVEIRVGLNQSDSPSYYCSLIFEQTIGNEKERVCDTYAVSRGRSVSPDNIGKTIASCTKTFFGKSFAVCYNFADGSRLQAWG